MINRAVLTIFIIVLHIRAISSSLLTQKTSNKYFNSKDVIDSPNCPILTVTHKNCVNHFAFVRYLNGTIWGGGYNKVSLSGCYDKDQCYMVEIGFCCYGCNVEIVMDGVPVLQQTVSTTNAMFTEKVIYAGKCDTQCPQKTALVLTNSVVNFVSKVRYSLYQVNGGHIKSTLPHSESQTLCIDLENCNILEDFSYGRAYLLQDNKPIDIEERSKDLSIGISKSMGELFGKCMNNCADLKVIVSITLGEIISYRIKEGDYLLEEGNIEAGKDKEICLNARKCNKVEWEGNAKFFVIKDGEVISYEGNAGFRHFGSCEKLCAGKPILASTQRGVDIFSAISSASTSEDLINIGNWRYEAICWLIYDDPKQLQSTDPSIVQRYVLALFYLSTAGWNWYNNLGFMTANDECSWGGVVCAHGFVNELSLGM